MISAPDALKRLKEGNDRFTSDNCGPTMLTNHEARQSLTEGQEPFAIILGCSDSRAPAELIFDQGLGDLFVIRVAGNIVAPSQIGSVEFAAGQLGSRLVVVLGHTECGAVGGTLQALQNPDLEVSPGLRSILDRVRPAVETLFEGDRPDDPAALMQDAVRANIRRSVEQLRRGSELLEELIRDQGLRIVGAEYCLATGKVEFLDDSEGLDDLP